MKKILLIVFLLSVSFNAAFLIHMFLAEQEPEPAVPIAGAEVNLNLTPQQKEKMEPIRHETHVKNEALKQQIAKHQKELLEAIETKPADGEKIREYVDKINDLQKQIQLNTVAEILAVRRLMTPEQCRCLSDGLNAQMTHQPCQCGCGDQTDTGENK